MKKDVVKQTENKEQKTLIYAGKALIPNSIHNSIENKKDYEKKKVTEIGSINQTTITMPFLATTSLVSADCIPTSASGVFFPANASGIWSGSVWSSGSIASGQIGINHLSSGLASGNYIPGTLSGSFIPTSASGVFFPANASGIWSGTSFSLASGIIQSGHIASGQIGINHLSSGLASGDWIPGSLSGSFIPTSASGVFFPANASGIWSGSVWSSGSIASGQIGKPHIASGSIGSGQLAATGTPTGSLFLRDDFVWSTTGGTFTNTAVKTAAYTAKNLEHVICDSNGASGNFAVSLPASPSTGDRVRVSLITDHATRKTTIDDNGSNINGGSANDIYYDLILEGDSVEFHYVGGDCGWRTIDEIRPHVSRMRNTIGSGVVNATTTQVLFDVASWDIGGVADLTNDRFLIRRAGKYLITARCWFGNWGTYSNMSLYVNGSITDYDNLGLSAGFESSRGFSMQMNLAAGDYVDYRVYQNSGTTQTYNTSDHVEPTFVIQEIR